MFNTLKKLSLWNKNFPPNVISCILCETRLCYVAQASLQLEIIPFPLLSGKSIVVPLDFIF